MLAAVLPGAVAAPPASALGDTLQVTPEVTTVQVGTAVTLTAHLTYTPIVSPLLIHFRFEGGPMAGQPDRTCTVPTGFGTGTCTVDTPAAVTAGSTLVRAWQDTRTIDEAEGRLSSASPSSAADADCTSDPNETPFSACTTGDTVTPGSAPEADTTDVVRITWRDYTLDLKPDTQDHPRSEGASLSATITASVFNAANQPAANVPVNFELFDGSVSDPGGGNTPNIPDRTCTTGGSGTCSITLTQTLDGQDYICGWVSATPPVMEGKVSTTAICAGETLADLSGEDGATFPNDPVDVARVRWGSAVPILPVVTPPPTTGPAGSGYWLVATDGGIFNFGDAAFKGSAGSIPLNQPIVGMAATPTGGGYWLVASDGGIFNYGDAAFKGSTGGIKLNKPIVGMARTPNGGGYWLVASDGGIFSFGNAVFRGSTGSMKLNQPIVGMAATPSGNGYWLVAADGGIFNFGDATFRGSTGSIKLNKPIVGMDATPSGIGYWLVATDGGIFNFGDAAFKGSTGGTPLNKPIVGMSRTSSGNGYRLVATDGGVFVFGDATFKGSTGGMKLNKPVVGMAGF
ncbi:MAG TPA: hypothetical protein VFJ85_02460 [Acidimicrobiales bacterium]|nr:hypothetical protein [Acidimicrobiales bacterium]